MFPQPPKSEQILITSVLDRETAKIDVLVDEQKRLIELLREKRRAIITHAVTKGLNPTAPMKPSGVEWIGEMPDHWNCFSLRRYFSCSSGEAISSESVTETPDGKGDVPVIGGNGIMGYSEQGSVQHSILAIGRVGALCGNVHLVDPPAWITDNALVLDARDDVLQLPYLCFALKARNLNDIASKTAQPLITSSQVLDQKMPCPPKFEQVQIAAWISSELAKLDELTTTTEGAIDFLRERRSAVITAAATGKIDVREVAVHKKAA